MSWDQCLVESLGEYICINKAPKSSSFKLQLRRNDFKCVSYIHNENLILMLNKQPTVSNLPSPLLTPFLLFIGRHVPNHYDKMNSQKLSCKEYLDTYLKGIFNTTIEYNDVILLHTFLSIFNTVQFMSSLKSSDKLFCFHC
jgi:hypothetical protein